MAVYSRLVGNVDGKSNSVTLRLPVASGVTVTQGDMVYFTSGRISSATITGDVRIIGQVQETATGNAGGTVKALVAVDQNSKYLMQADQALTASNLGQYMDLTGATGAQKVLASTASNTTGVVVCLDVAPGIAPVQADTTYGLFKIVEHAFSPLGA